MPWFEVRDLVKKYPLEGKQVHALNGISFDLDRGDFVAIVGRSGSGKTTLLRILAGLVHKSSGSLFLDGEELQDGDYYRVGMVFQEPRLMPWLTVEKNILFPFLNGNKKDLPIARAQQLLEILGLTAFKNAYPSQLSGGMAQRVALGRMLCYDPELILMDEPLSALDYFTRRSLQEEILHLHKQGGKTMLLVTHDVEEAILLSKRIFILDEGRLIDSIHVDLPYPRNRSSQGFFSLWERILSLIEKGTQGES